MKYLKATLLVIIVAVFCFSPSFAAEKYCYVDGGMVVVGPKKLPDGWRNISGFNNLSDADLKMLGWLPREVVALPEYNTRTQHITTAYTVNESSVTPVYTVVESYIDNPPEFNPATQYLTRVASVNGKITTWIYIINNYTQEELDAITAQAVVAQKIIDAKELMTLSGLANLTYAQIATHVENTFSNLTPEQRTSLTKLYQTVLAGLKRNNWSK